MFAVISFMLGFARWPAKELANAAHAYPYHTDESNLGRRGPN